jgi:ABC-2 type transport system ATP-binding protein
MMNENLDTEVKKEKNISNNETVLAVENITKTFQIFDKEIGSIRDTIFNFREFRKKRIIKALNNVSFEVKKGEVFGIIGRNGSGKSTLLKIISKAFPPDKGGKVEVNGKLIRLALGMCFDKELTARENIYLNGSIMGLSFKKIGERFQEIIDFADLQEFTDTKVKFFSSGMVSRLSFSIAIRTDADIILIDEILGVGDAGFKHKSEQVFRNTLLNEKTVIIIDHDLYKIKKYCDRVLLLNKGEVKAIGPPDEMISLYEGLFV